MLAQLAFIARLATTVLLSSVVTATSCVAATREQREVPVQFTIKIPRPGVFSPTLAEDGAQLLVSVSEAGQTGPSPVSFGCNFKLVPALCTGVLQAPLATDWFVIQLADSKGTILSNGFYAQTIVAGVANSVRLSFSGPAATISLSGPSSIVIGRPTVSTLTITEKDADQDTIIGPYTSVVSLSLTGDRSNSTLLTETTLTASTQDAIFMYNGDPKFVSVSIAASPSSGAAPPSPVSIVGVAAPRVMTFLGDSITWGGYTASTPFPAQIGAALQIPVNNLGIPNIRIPEALASEVPAVPANTTDVVIYLGTNDVFALLQGSETLAGVEMNLRAMVYSLLSKGMRVYMLTVRDFTVDPNWHPHPSPTQAQVKVAHFVTAALDDWILALPGVQVLDIRRVPELMDLRNYEDGFHLSPVGTAAYAKRIMILTRLPKNG